MSLTHIAGVTEEQFERKWTREGATSDMGEGNVVLARPRM